MGRWGRMFLLLHKWGGERGSADFGGHHCGHVLVPGEVLYSLLVGFRCFLQDTFHLLLLSSSQRPPAGEPLVQEALLFFLILSTHYHRFLEFHLAFILHFLLPLSHVKICDAFQLQGSLLKRNIFSKVFFQIRKNFILYLEF
jgi:hypothetical protein